MQIIPTIRLVLNNRVFLIAVCLFLSLSTSTRLRALSQGTYQVNGRPATEEEFHASQLITQGVQLLNQNQNAAAADIFAQAIKLGPSLPAAHLDYGIALSKINKNDLAITELKQAIQLDPDKPSPYLNLAGVYQTQGQIDLALGVLTEFKNRFPTHPDAAKVASLIQGLSRLNATLPPSSGGPQGGDRGAGGNNAPDYFAEATPQGVHRWSNSAMPIKVYVRPGAGVYLYKEQDSEILKRAFFDWAACSAGKVRFQFVNDRSDANIECSWIADSGQLANAAEAGETRLTLASGGGNIMHATIALLTVPLVASLPLTDNRLRFICLHEIGHALGFVGHTRNPSDIMFYSEHITDDWIDLSARDKNTLVRLYSVPVR